MKHKEIDVWISTKNVCTAGIPRQWSAREMEQCPVKAKLIIPVEPEVVEFSAMVDVKSREDGSYIDLYGCDEIFVHKKLHGKKWIFVATEVIDD